MACNFSVFAFFNKKKSEKNQDSNLYKLSIEENFVELLLISSSEKNPIILGNTNNIFLRFSLKQRCSIGRMLLQCQPECRL